MTLAFLQAAETLLGVTLYFPMPILTPLYMCESKVNVEKYSWPIFGLNADSHAIFKDFEGVSMEGHIYFPGLADDRVVEEAMCIPKLL